MGLFSAPHCLAMCGGLMSAMGLNSDNNRFWPRLVGVLKVNLGRLFSYGLLGLLAGLLGMTFHQLLPGAGVVLRCMAGGLLMVMGLYIGGWWLGLRHLEQALYGLWTRLQKLCTGVTNHSRGGRDSKMFTGLLWGCLPCGLVYSALSMAMTLPTPWQGGLFMVSFGFGTLPVLMGAGMMSASFAQFIRHKWVKSGAGIALIGFGLWTLVGFFAMDHAEHSGHSGHSAHGGQTEQEHHGHH